MVEIREESSASLPDYGTVPIAFRVESRFRVEPIRQGLGGLVLVEEPVTPPYVKDYDAVKDEGPTRWRQRWDLSRWGVLGAFDDGIRIGGAVIAWNTAGVNMLRGRDDLAVLWDLRVHPAHRRRGVGHALFVRALAWAEERQCREFLVETQTLNVPACRFYAREGCHLCAVNPDAYPDLPDEVQLLWRRDLSPRLGNQGHSVFLPGL